MQRSASMVTDFYKLHKELRFAEFDKDEFIRVRIQKCREYVEKCVKVCGALPNITDLGCGCGEICGPFHECGKASVLGIDCNTNALLHAAKKYGIHTLNSDLSLCKPGDGDVLVMCDVLEHVEFPSLIAFAWLPLYRYCVISHPLNESHQNREHKWIFSEEDFENWFYASGFRILEKEKFVVPGINVETIIGIGRRNDL